MTTPHILVVDDDPAIRSLLEHILTDDGYVVESAIDGRDAIRLLTKRSPDLIVLDLLMPDGNGTVVANVLRALHRSIPILVLSGAVDADEWSEEIGATAFLRKPFRLADLHAVVGRVCAA